MEYKNVDCIEVLPVTKGGEGIGSVSRVQITPGRDGIFSTVGRGAVTLGEGVFRVIVVSLTRAKL